LRARADQSLEAIPEGRRGAEPDQEGDLLDGMRGSLEQLLRMAHPSPV
jgi:hypothetical protein